MLWRTREPRHGAMHLRKRVEHGRSDRQGGVAHLEAARCRSCDQGDRGPVERDHRDERQLELSLQQARYEAAHARRQYDAVDPANRLVAGELERRWNEALQAVAKIEGDIAALIARRPPPLGEPERRQLIALGADIERAWSHSGATAATRKRILRTAISEIIVRRDGAIIHAVLHWQGGDHTELQEAAATQPAGTILDAFRDGTIALMSELARLMPDRQIARLLNRIGVETGHGNAWTLERVRGFRKHHEIEGYRDGEWAERGEITLEAAAKIVGVCNMTALRMLRRGEIKGRQVCPALPGRSRPRI